MRTLLTDGSTRRSLSLERVGRSGFGAAKEDPTGWAYNQAAFQYFLTLEQKRSELAGRVFALLLVDKQAGGATVAFEADAASWLFVTLRRCLRDTDLLGWYQEGLVVGAVLTHQAECPASIERLIEDRLGRTILESLQREGGARIQVRMFQPSMATKARVQSWP